MLTLVNGPVFTLRGQEHHDPALAGFNIERLRSRLVRAHRQSARHAGDHFAVVEPFPKGERGEILILSNSNSLGRYRYQAGCCDLQRRLFLFPLVVALVCLASAFPNDGSQAEISLA
jgi:hypothetical protein